MRDEKGKWLPGESGNPSGRPRGISPLKILASVIAEKGEDDARRIAENLIWLAQQPDFRAVSVAKEIMDRLDGAVVKRQDISVTGDKVKVVRLAGDEDDERDGEGVESEPEDEADCAD